jgi:hypothetical protein
MWNRLACFSADTFKSKCLLLQPLVGGCVDGSVKLMYCVCLFALRQIIAIAWGMAACLICLILPWWESR